MQICKGARRSVYELGPTQPDASVPRTFCFPMPDMAIPDIPRLAPAGASAPDFELRSTPDQTVRLADFRGRPVVLAFYPADWSPVCGDQVALYNEMFADFEENNALVLGISVDGA